MQKRRRKAANLDKEKMLLETKKQVVKHRLQLKEEWEAKKKKAIYDGRKTMSMGASRRNRSVGDRDHEDFDFNGEEHKFADEN